MSTNDVERQLKAEDLARSKEMIDSILAGWDLLTWNELLADISFCRSGRVRWRSVELASFGDAAMTI